MAPRYAPKGSMYWQFGLVVPYLPPANSLLADKLYDKHLKS